MPESHLPSHHYSRWEQQLRAQADWWEQEEPQRPILRVTAPAVPEQQRETFDVWCYSKEPDEPQKHINRLAECCAQTRYLGDAFPHCNPLFAAGVLATLVHGHFEVMPDTVWVEKPTDWSELEDICFDENDIWWQRMELTVRRAIEAGFVTATPDIGGELDICAAVRGTQNLLMDLIDCPERVQRLRCDVQALWFEAFDRFYAMMEPAYGGSCNRWGFFAAGKQYPLQCDFAAMLSPDMFAEFVVPALEADCQFLDYGIYHLDGPGQIAHLDHLLKIDNLRVIQWVPGAGNPGTDDSTWFDMYHRIQDTGRALVLGGNVPTIKRFLDEFDPGLLQLSTWVADDDQFRDLMDTVDEACA
ncbi:MAG: hypothetical protein R6V19_05585 [Armatimonadota bacterium]